jgi:hypothetical protein
VDVVVGDLRVLRGGPGEQDRAAGRVGQPPDRPGLEPQQVAVGDRQVRVEHDDVGGDPLAVGRDHRRGPGAVVLHAGHGRRVADRHAVLLGSRCQGRRDRMHAPLGEEDAGHRVHVGDDRVDRQRIVRAHPGVHGLEGEDPLGPRVLEVVVGLGGHAPEATDGGQPGEVGGEQVERAVDVAVDEVGHLQLVELGGEVDVAPVAGSLLGSDHDRDLVGHRVHVGVHVQLRPVGEVGAVDRADRGQLQPVGHLFADAGEGVLDQPRHRQDGGSGVEPVARLGDHPRTPARDVLALEDRDGATGAGQPEGGAQAGQSSADDDDVLGRADDGTGIAEGDAHGTTVCAPCDPRPGGPVRCQEQALRSRPGAGP